MSVLRPRELRRNEARAGADTEGNEFGATPANPRARVTCCDLHVVVGEQLHAHSSLGQELEIAHELLCRHSRFTKRFDRCRAFGCDGSLQIRACDRKNPTPGCTNKQVREEWLGASRIRNTDRRTYFGHQLIAVGANSMSGASTGFSAGGGSATVAVAMLGAVLSK